MIELCIMIFDGILGQGIVLDYLISVPAVDDPTSPCPINDDICLGTLYNNNTIIINCTLEKQCILLFDKLTLILFIFSTAFEKTLR